MKKTVFKLVMIAVLFLSGLFFLYRGLTSNGFGFFNLQTFGENDEFESKGINELIKGDIVTGQFHSRFSNLGIISVRFTNHNRDSKDTLLFRIKEQNADKWEYIARYNTDQFLPEELFPFGFPLIKDSVKKNYIFEIESLYGATGSGIFLGSNKPIFTVNYFYDKKSLFVDKNRLIKFLVQKTINTFENRQTQLQTIIAFLLFLFYLAHLKLNRDRQILLFPIFLAGVVFDIFYVSINSNYHISALIFLWVLITLKRKVKLESMGFISLLLLFITFVSLLFGKNIYAEKSIIWFLITLVMAVLQALSMTKISSKEDINLYTFLNQLDSLSKTNKTISAKTIKVITVFLSLITTYILYLWISNIYNSFVLFFEFYPNDTPYISMALLGMAIISVSVMSIYIFNYLKRKFSLNIHLTCTLLLFAIYLSSSIIISNATTFRYIPKIHSVSPSITSEAWVDVTINGKNFQNLPFVGKVTLAGEVQVENVHYWSNEKIIFRTNPATTKTGEVCVQTLSKGISNCLPFEYNFNQKH